MPNPYSVYLQVRFFHVLILLVCCGTLSAQTDSTGALKGLVIDDATGEAIPFARIIVLKTRLGCETDISGNYRLTSVPIGEQQFRISCTGYYSDTISIVITSKGGQTRNFHLKPFPVEHGQDTIAHIDPKVIPNGDCPSEPRFPQPSNSFNKKRCALVAGTEAVLSVGSLVALSQVWYKDYPRTTFHTFDDNREWLQMDKIGHMQTAYTTGLISFSLLNWSGVRYEKSTWIGGLTGFAYLTAIEIMDGYSQGWGFSTGDMLANASGSALFISQQYIWKEQRIMPKFGFQRSGFPQYRPDLLGTDFKEELIKDYNGQTYWLSVNVASFLSVETRFPQWLNVAFGYGATGMTGGHENPAMTNAQGNEITFNRYRQYYFSFDIDLRKIPVKSRFLKAVFTTISFIKIPAPGIELSQNGVRPLLFAF